MFRYKFTLKLTKKCDLQVITFGDHLFYKNKICFLNPAKNVSIQKQDLAWSGTNSSLEAPALHCNDIEKSPAE